MMMTMNSIYELRVVKAPDIHVTAHEPSLPSLYAKNLHFLESRIMIKSNKI
jgi:hypothetical protein